MQDEAKLLVEQEWKNEVKRLKERLHVVAVAIGEIAINFSQACQEERTLTQKEFNYCFLALTTAAILADPDNPSDKSRLPSEILKLVAAFERRIALAAR